MYIDVIKGILNSDIDVQDKLDKISIVVRKAEEIENLAIEFAREQADDLDMARIEPSWEHRLKAINILNKSGHRETSVLNRKELVLCLEGAVGFLKKIIVENGSWEIRSPFRPYIQKEKPTEALRPLHMLFVAPWEIGLCISALYDWVQFVQPEDRLALNLISDGSKYLQQVQLSLGNGGLGDSFWIEEIQPCSADIGGNTLETSVSLLVWTMHGSADLPKGLSHAIEKALGYLMGSWNDDGGWGFKPFCKSDIKSTSIVVMVILAMLKRLEFPPSRRTDLCRLAGAGMRWILNDQNQDGSWSYDYTSRDSRTSGSFYAIEAMALSKFYLEDNQKADGSLLGKESEDKSELRRAIDTAYWKSLKWYETSYKLMSGEKGGWCWWEHDPSSAAENTAASLVVLLDTEWLDETSPLAEQAMKWLMNARDTDYWWEVSTPMVIKAAIRMLHKPSRLRQKLKLVKEQSREVPELCMVTGM
ncbi:MAG: prenyltransferase/squalene oxidase repeat-containing protein [Syntrophobacteraceae bacterium]